MMEEESPPSYFDSTTAFPPAPSADTYTRSTASSSNTVLSASFPPLCEKDIKDACYLYVTAHCCYGSSFVDNMWMTCVTNKVAYVYTLESFGEKRETATQIRRYDGVFTDSLQNGRPPQPWDIPVTPLKYFDNHHKNVEIPNTVYSTMCTQCTGKGTSTCVWCWGIGGKGCYRCLFDENNRPCSSCALTFNRCLFCEGRGKNPCGKCGGSGKLRACKMLTVMWTNHVDHFISDTEQLPSEKILEAEGKVLFTEEEDKLLPICDAVDVSVNVGSTDLINRHRTCFQEELVIKQRHVLRAVPYTYVAYQWKNQMGGFYVYGLQKKAYFDSYPEQCCCGCSIM